MPVAVMALGGAAGFVKYQDGMQRAADRAAADSVQAAKDSTVALLSYTPDTAEQSLTAARDRLIGTFRDSYTTLTRDVVIPGAIQQKISATATVPAASSVSASRSEAKVLLFVNQAIVIDGQAPTQTNSVVEVTLTNVDGRWLISGFEPK
ncbi:hypothetical protein PDG61_20175 [Mycolicibacterium sp. BiH015]|uniref:hypothetical protein n=1 Tax=Mycolicibacterium sp. BiH015 TaxID=3018808 RepID=UPI0022E0A106|nr:hypothetical protein [Mycolicibacterium sp. BiH015]MDA2893248.1 hypothetical protein [Mycolicibacterium sp. BiH015]